MRISFYTEAVSIYKLLVSFSLSRRNYYLKGKAFNILLYLHPTALCRPNMTQKTFSSHKLHDSTWTWTFFSFKFTSCFKNEYLGKKMASFLLIKMTFPFIGQQTQVIIYC